MILQVKKQQISALVIFLLFFQVSIFFSCSSTYAATGYTLKGYLKPDFNFTDITLYSGFKVEILEAGMSTLSDSDGYFQISNIQPRAEGYSIKISKDNYLYRLIPNVVISTDIIIGSSSEPIAMWVGDMLINGVQDNAINQEDVMAVTKLFNTTIGDGKYDVICDLDKDGAINLVDILIVYKHFNTIVAHYPTVSVIKVTPTPTPTKSILYIYDDNGRLDYINVNGKPMIDYIYDKNGNLIKKQVIK